MEPLTMMVLYFGARALCRWLDSAEGKATVEAVQRVALLAWNTVSNWLRSSRVSSADCGTLIREKLANGDYRIVCGAFSATGAQRSQTVWECTDLDGELRRKLGNRDRITINL
jgi:hypothetical protein